MYFTVYKITNQVNNKIYIGVHKTNNLDDDYMSSSEVVHYAIKKYGIDKFKKEILFCFDNSTDMFDKEAELVNEEFVQRNDVYNLKVGGYGGWDHIHYTNEHREYVKMAGAARKTQMENFGNPFSGIQTEYNFAINEEFRKRVAALANTPEAIAKRKKTWEQNKTHQGKNNSQYGKKIYIDSLFDGDLPNISILNGQRYKPGEEPNGWILLSVWRDNKKCKSRSYGKCWYNNTIKNYLLYPNDPIIEKDKLIKGRIMTGMGKQNCGSTINGC